MAECLTAEGAFGNPSSVSHDYGERAAELVESARAQVAACVGAEPAEVVWTSGATEANNLAIFGAAHYYRGAGKHIVTARTRAQVGARSLPRARAARLAGHLSRRPDADGVLDPGANRRGARARDGAGVGHARQQRDRHDPGYRGDRRALRALRTRRGCTSMPRRASAKCDLDFAALGRRPDVAVGAQGLRAQRGGRADRVAAARRVQLTPLLHGGGQERSLRSGTIATHQVVGMGAAFDAGERRGRARSASASAALRERLWRGLSALGGVRRNGEPCALACRTSSMCRSKAWRAKACSPRSRARIAVSTGSACTSAQREPSYVLRALGPRRPSGREQSALQPRAATRAPPTSTRRSTSWRSAVRRLRRISGHVIYSELTRRYFEDAACAGALSGRGLVPRRGRKPRAGHLGAIRRARAARMPAAASGAVRFLAFGCPHVIAVAAMGGGARGRGGAPPCGCRRASRRCARVRGPGREAGPAVDRGGCLGRRRCGVPREQGCRRFCSAMHDDMLKNALRGPVGRDRREVCKIQVRRSAIRGLPDMAISLTESAAERVRSHLAKRGAGVGLRVGIKKTGCSGFAYVVNYADEIHPGDAVFEARGVKSRGRLGEPAADRRHLGRFRQTRPERGVQVPKSESQGRMRLRRELQRLVPDGARAARHWRVFPSNTGTSADRANCLAGPPPVHFAVFVGPLEGHPRNRPEDHHAHRAHSLHRQAGRRRPQSDRRGHEPLREGGLAGGRRAHDAPLASRRPRASTPCIASGRSSRTW